MLVPILLGIAVLLCLLCSLGLLVMRDSYQRLHFAAPITSVGIILMVAAIWIDDGDFQARAKSVLIAAMLFFMNSILSHATARAIRIRRLDHWPVKKAERIPLVDAYGKPKAIAP